MIGRRRGGLVRTAARTAVVAGTATAVAGNVSRRQQQRHAEEDAAQQTQASAAEVEAALQKLTDMKEQGLITEEEFTAKKQQILGL